jgi:hypothetical protein
MPKELPKVRCIIVDPRQGEVKRWKVFISENLASPTSHLKRQLSGPL